MAAPASVATPRTTTIRPAVAAATGVTAVAPVTGSRPVIVATGDVMM